MVELAEELGVSHGTLSAYFRKAGWPDGNIEKMREFIQDTQANAKNKRNTNQQESMALLKEQKLKIEIEALTEKLNRAKDEMKAEIYQELSQELFSIFDGLKEIYSRLPLVYQKELQAEVDKMRKELCK